jgi:PPIC-type PPIASE domain
MKTVRRVLAEPLVQFLIIGVAVFALYSLRSGPDRMAEREMVVVSPGRVAQLAETFSRTWQRPPTRQELDGLIDAFVKEEIFYREGRKLGLDTDDTVFRRRLQQKMEFLMEPSVAELMPAEDEVEAYLAAHADQYKIPERIAFRQLYFDPGKHGDATESDALQVLATIENGAQSADTEEFGDPTLLPFSMPPTRVDQIALSFGTQFTDALVAAETGRWIGPVESTFGLHLIYIDESLPARNPALAEIREEVERDWEADRRRQIAEERYRALRQNYEVKIELPEALSDAPTAAAAQ